MANALTQITVDQKVQLSVSFVDDKGNPDSPVTVPAWSSSNGAVATVVAAPDGLSATVSAAGEGTATITASTTDSNGTVISAAHDIQVVAGEPALASIAVGAVSAK